MKLIFAVFKPFKLDEVREALTEIGPESSNYGGMPRRVDRYCDRNDPQCGKHGKDRRRQDFCDAVGRSGSYSYR